MKCFKYFRYDEFDSDVLELLEFLNYLNQQMELHPKLIVEADEEQLERLAQLVEGVEP